MWVSRYAHFVIIVLSSFNKATQSSVWAGPLLQCKANLDEAISITR